MKSPCMGCEHREVGCHSRCAQYQAFSDKYEEIRNERKKFVELTNYIAIESDKNVFLRSRKRRCTAESSQK